MGVWPPSTTGSCTLPATAPCLVQSSGAFPLGLGRGVLASAAHWDRPRRESLGWFFSSLGLSFLFCKIRGWKLLPPTPPAWQTSAPSSGRGDSGTAPWPSWPAAPGSEGTRSICFEDSGGILGSAWAAWAEVCLVPIVPGLHVLPGHNAPCLLSSRSGLDKLSAFFFPLIF